MNRARGPRESTAATALAVAVLLVVVLAGCGAAPHASGGGATPPPGGSPAPALTATAPAPQTLPSGSCGAWDCAWQPRFAAATALIRSRPGYLGIVVQDRQTGAIWRAGTPDHVMWASSTPKLAMAVSLLERARSGAITLDATARAQLAAMLHVSDDNAADALWNRYGRDAMVPRFQQVYGMARLRFVPGFPRRWGFLKYSAEDLRRLMLYVLTRLDPADRDYLLHAMRTVGQIQQWGVWAAGAAAQPGNKNGWSIESDPGGRHWCTSSVGFAGPDARYVVAVMYHLPPGTGTIGAGVHTVSDLVATVFGVPTPAPVTVPDPRTGL